jgi:hypothetical protein
MRPNVNLVYDFTKIVKKINRIAKDCFLGYLQSNEKKVMA